MLAGVGAAGALVIVVELLKHVAFGAKLSDNHLSLLYSTAHSFWSRRQDEFRAKRLKHYAALHGH